MAENSLRRQSSPASPSPAMVEKAIRQKRRRASSTFTDAAKGHRTLRRSSRSVAVWSHDGGPLEACNTYESDRASSPYEDTYEDIAPTSPLILDHPPAGRYIRVMMDEAGHANQNQPSSRTMSWTRRLSREFSTSTDLTTKLKLACDMPGAVTKDAGNIFTSSCFTCAKALADYWKPTKTATDRRRVESINSSGFPSPLHTPSFSTSSGWSRSSRSSHSSQGSTYMEGLQNIDVIKADRKSDGTGDDMDVVTIYGVTEWGPPVVARFRQKSR